MTKIIHIAAPHTKAETPLTTGLVSESTKISIPGLFHKNLSTQSPTVFGIRS